jgi:hypothetical protein
VPGCWHARGAAGCWLAVDTVSAVCGVALLLAGAGDPAAPEVLAG